MSVKLNINEALRSIELGKESAIEIFNKSRNYSSFYLKHLIEKSKHVLMRFKCDYVDDLIGRYSKIFKVISDEDKRKLAMESLIEDINKYKNLIKLYENEIKMRNY